MFHPIPSGNSTTRALRQVNDHHHLQEVPLVVNIAIEMDEIGPLIVRLVVEKHPSEKYEFVNWDDDSNPIYGKIKLMATIHHQAVVDLSIFRW